ncbi:hypothetical protein [Roseovarius sp. 217]|uniref:hypothetical protein n=1 Tax=Roseovarius sp. (strain 217) TaxID=314264 RepID=UPI0000685888|nr:hypothetical protein [Roseovarius sp. 217]EAQ27480.1 hypothetical protein ROS217_23177 [Roseovarius sp. 217]
MPREGWISELDEYGYNFLIDELVFHLEAGRKVKAIEKLDKSNTDVGFEFVFLDDTDSFLKVPPELISDHWNEAQQIVQAFPMLLQVQFIET